MDFISPRKKEKKTKDQKSTKAIKAKVKKLPTVGFLEVSKLRATSLQVPENGFCFAEGTMVYEGVPSKTIRQKTENAKGSSPIWPGADFFFPVKQDFEAQSLLFCVYTVLGKKNIGRFEVELTEIIHNISEPSKIVDLTVEIKYGTGTAKFSARYLPKDIAKAQFKEMNLDNPPKSPRRRDTPSLENSSMDSIFPISPSRIISDTSKIIDSITREYSKEQQTPMALGSRKILNVAPLKPSKSSDSVSTKNLKTSNPKYKQLSKISESSIFHTLEITINELKDVYEESQKNMDTLCVVNVENQWEQTTNTSSPKLIFDSSFEFDIKDKTNTEVKIYVLQTNGKKNTPFGKIVLPLKDITGGKTTSLYDFNFFYSKTYVAGEILILTKWEKELKMLSVIVKEGRNIAYPNTNFDCYAVVDLEVDKVKKKKSTKVASYKNQVKWNDRLQFVTDTVGTLIVSVWKNQQMEGKGPRFLGSVTIYAQSIVGPDNSSHVIENSYLLSPNQDSLKRLELAKFDEFRRNRTTFGSARLTIDFKKLSVFPIDHYNSLLKILEDYMNELIIILRRTTIKRDRGVISNSLLNIYECLQQTQGLLEKLIVEEIKHSQKAETLFRLDNLTTKTIDTHLKKNGHHYLRYLLGPTVNKINASGNTLEIDPSKLGKNEDIKKNFKEFMNILKELLERLYLSAKECPSQARYCLYVLQREVKKKYPNKENVGNIVIAGVFFLRFLGPALLTPKSSRIIDILPNPVVKTALNNVTKTIQRIANPNSASVVKGIQTEQPEYSFMVELDRFIEDERPRMKEFMNNLSSEDTFNFHYSESNEHFIERDLAALEEHLKATRDDIKIIVETPPAPPEDDSDDSISESDQIMWEFENINTVIITTIQPTTTNETPDSTPQQFVDSMSSSSSSPKIETLSSNSSPKLQQTESMSSSSSSQIETLSNNSSTKQTEQSGINYSKFGISNIFSFPRTSASKNSPSLPLKLNKVSNDSDKDIPSSSDDPNKTVTSHKNSSPNLMNAVRKISSNTEKILSHQPSKSVPANVSSPRKNTSQRGMQNEQFSTIVEMFTPLRRKSARKTMSIDSSVSSMESPKASPKMISSLDSPKKFDSDTSLDNISSLSYELSTDSKPISKSKENIIFRDINESTIKIASEILNILLELDTVPSITCSSEKLSTSLGEHLPDGLSSLKESSDTDMARNIFIKAYYATPPNSIKIGTHHHSIKTYTDCFKGSELIDFIGNKLDCPQKVATSHASQLLSLYFIYPLYKELSMTRIEPKGLYRFFADKDRNLLNLYRLYIGVPRHPLTISIELFRYCMDLVSQYKLADRQVYDYAAIVKSNKTGPMYDATLGLQKVVLSKLTKEEKLCLFINVYNVLLVHINVLLADNPQSNVREEYLNSKAYCIGGLNYSLFDIEHGILRGNRPKPGGNRKHFMDDDKRLNYSLEFDQRIHFSILLGSLTQPIDTDNMDQQLNNATTKFLLNDSIIDIENKLIKISPLFNTYAADFGDKNKTSLINFITKYVPDNCPLKKGLTLDFNISYHNLNKWDPNNRIYTDDSTIKQT